MDMSSIGANIRSARVRRKWRQEDLAEKTGLSPNYIGAIERGEKIPALETLLTIINVLGVSSGAILNGVVEADYDVKLSLMSEMLVSLDREDCETVCAVVDTLAERLRHE